MNTPLIVRELFVSHPIMGGRELRRELHLFHGDVDIATITDTTAFGYAVTTWALQHPHVVILDPL